MQLNQAKNPADFGFSPQASAAANVAALQRALDGGGLVVIDTPGAYDLNDTIFLDSDTRLVCAPGVIFRKVAPYCNVLVNRGALTKTYNENITLEGLEVSVNEQEGNPTLVPGLRAQLGFHYVKGLTLRDVKCLDGGPHQYLMYVVTWEHLRLENVRLAGDKDGLKLNNGHDAVIRDLDLTTYDDGLSVCGTDYASTLVEVGDVYNVRYVNVTDHQYKNIFGRTCLIYTGSWAEYRNGNEYGSGDFCLHEGRLYQVIGDGGFLADGAAPPTHTAGTVTGADGIPWRFVQPCDFYDTHVFNVTFDNCIFEKSGNIVANFTVPDWYYREREGVHRPSYPGTETNTTCRGISLNNCRLAGQGPQVLVNVMGNLRDVTFNGCHLDNPHSTLINVDEDAVKGELLASVSGCLFSAGLAGPPAEPLPDHQNCPLLRRDMNDTGKLVAVHSGGRVVCSAAGNSYRGEAVECAVSHGSLLRFPTLDLPLQSREILTPEHGDLCRDPEGLWVYGADGWGNLSAGE
jgi:hypothetical protein